MTVVELVGDMRHSGMTFLVVTFEYCLPPNPLFQPIPARFHAKRDFQIKPGTRKWVPGWIKMYSVSCVTRKSLRSQGKNIIFFIVIVYAITNRLNCDAKMAFFTKFVVP